ncbi:MAG: hypothetical protein GY731_09615, partial [Gammaproteobacteria bacterium]|nr:hypothetical protein [Gammaproteobacteria bacterium]
DNTQTIDGTGGTGQIVFANGSGGYQGQLYRNTAGDTLTLGPNVEIRGANTGTAYIGYYADDQITNQGTVTADVAGKSFRINGDFSNAGTLGVYSGTTLTFESSSSFSNAGLIYLDSGNAVSTSNNSFTNELAGIIAGNGTLQLGTGTLTNDGTLRPGASPGLLTIDGDLVLTSTSITEVEVAGLARGTPTGYDAIDVTGVATLDGTVNVTHLPGYAPVDGHTFLAVTATGGISGAFNTINAPVTYNAQYDATNALLQVGASAIPVNLWNTDLSGDWGTAGNWSLGVPTSGQVALIDRGTFNPTVTVNTAGEVADVLQSTENLTVSAGSLAVTSGGNIDTTLAISGGTFTTDGPLTVGSLNLSSGILGGSATLTVSGLTGWTGGTFGTGGGKTIAAGGLNISGGSVRSMNDY